MQKLPYYVSRALLLKSGACTPQVDRFTSLFGIKRVPFTRKNVERAEIFLDLAWLYYRFSGKLRRSKRITDRQYIEANFSYAAPAWPQFVALHKQALKNAAKRRA